MTAFFRTAFQTTFFLTAALIYLAFSATPAPAMGRSEDPRDAQQPLGTAADPAIRDSDQNLHQLLFKPASSSSGAGLVPAEDRPSAAATSGSDGSRRE